MYIAKNIQNATAIRAIKYAKAANVNAIPLPVAEMGSVNYSTKLLIHTRQIAKLNGGEHGRDVEKIM